jgi:hypothetical protein
MFELNKEGRGVNRKRVQRLSGAPPAPRADRTKGALVHVGCFSTSNL